MMVLATGQIKRHRYGRPPSRYLPKASMELSNVFAGGKILQGLCVRSTRYLVAHPEHQQPLREIAVIFH
jgi:hypothetical protein